MKALSLFWSASLGFVVLFTSLQSQAASCFHNPEEFKAQSSSVPPLLKKMPMLGSVDSVIAGVTAVATLKIRTAGDRFKYEARHLDDNEVKEQSEYIQEICYDQSKIEITLENGKSYQAELTEGGFKFRKNFLVRIDFVSEEKEFARVTHKMENVKNSSSSSQQNSGAR